ncbi:RNA polymerase sigma factor [Hyphobacterium sp.]|uniref:RNA polymerase sigma factor n=1 Tax=Hyphobacterium sp. TaxID=2004662 RepID=UPI003BAA343B
MADRTATDPARAAETAARNAYGRILALLASRCGDLAKAEDALSEAFARALARWPESGVPDTPDAWLLTTARRILIDEYRHHQTADGAQADLITLMETSETLLEKCDAIPDERLKLLFVCAHPEIDPALRTPLMLQTVLGLNAERIAGVFLLKPGTMSQRLVRLKTRLKDGDIPFEEPDRDQWPERLDVVMGAIYAAFTAGWDQTDGQGLADEALFLARLLAQLAPYEAEAAGLLSLILHCEARRPARRDSAGQFVPLDQQDTALWDDGLIAEAERTLGTALRMGRVGQFQLEAALQSAHNARKQTGQTDWVSIVAIYNRLLAISPTLGAMIGRASAIGEAVSAEAGLKALEELPPDRVAQHQPYWATRAHLLAQVGHNDPARDAYEIAIGLTSDSAVRAFLMDRRNAL